MLMGDNDIHEAIRYGHLVIDPFDPNLVQQVSVDFRLGRTIRLFDAGKNGYEFIDPTIEQPNLTYEHVIPKGQHFVLEPGKAILAHTYERFALSPSVCGRVDGKSSLGRSTLRVHATAGLVDPGFGTDPEHGPQQITLELDVSGELPVVLRPGMLIGQMSFERLAWPVSQPYGHENVGSHYIRQDGPTPARPVKVYPI